MTSVFLISSSCLFNEREFQPKSYGANLSQGKKLPKFKWFLGLDLILIHIILITHDTMIVFGLKSYPEKL